MSDNVRNTEGHGAIRLALADTITSVLIVLVSTFMGGLLSGLRNILAAEGFFNSLLSVAANFFALFALGDIASIVYWHYRGEKRIRLHRSDSLQAVACAVGIVSIGLLYSILKGIRTPYLSHVLAVVVGLVFGFSFGVELKLESVARETDQSKRTRTLFDHSLKDNLPYVFLLFAYVFPVDFFLERAGGFNLLSLISYGLLLAPYVYLSGLIARKGLGRIEISLKNNFPTVVIVVALSLGSMLGFIYWDMASVHDMDLEPGSVGMKVFALFFFGLVPIRMIPLIFLKTDTVNKIVGGLSLVYYIARKIQVL